MGTDLRRRGVVGDLAREVGAESGALSVRVLMAAQRPVGVVRGALGMLRPMNSRARSRTTCSREVG